MEVKLKDIFLALTICVVTYFLVGRLVGMAAAIATPEGYFEWFSVKGVPWVSLPLWNLTTIVPALVVPLFLMVFFVVKYLSVNWLTVFITTAGAYLVYFYSSLFFTFSEYPSLYELNGYKVLIPQLTIIITVFLASFIARKRITKLSN